MKNRSKVRKFANLAIQLILLGITYGFIFRQVFLKNDLPGMFQNLKGKLVEPFFIEGFALVVLLMAVNWGIESWKWRMLIGKIEKIGFFQSFQAVLTGVSISSFTPNRIGEFFGRVFILKKASHIEGILVTILGSMSQLMITILGGSVAILVFIPNYLSATPLGHGYLYYTFLAVAVIFNLLLLSLFYNISFVTALKEILFKRRFGKFRKFLGVFSFYRHKEITTILLLSLFRYVVFSFQFYLLLRILGVVLPFFHAQLLISLIFFIMAMIPTIALAELGIRGSVSLYIFGLYYSQIGVMGHAFVLPVLASSTLLWLINLGLPALAGTFFLFRLQFFRNHR